MIPQNFIEEISQKTNIIELINSYLPLKRAGKNFKACCPFHSEKTPSFVVSPQKQIFHCFGCGQGGGVIQFVMQMEKLTFVEAVELLAKKLNLNLPFQSDQQDKNKNLIYDVVNEASLFFHKNLLENKQLTPIHTYLKNRQINLDEIKKFRLGFALGKNSLLNHLRTKGFSLDIMEKASLIVTTQNGFRDLFSDRIIFPIFDIRSRVIGFGGRIWQDKANAPKYINSLENSIYSKRYHLYGLNFAKDAIINNDAVIIVEGYLDMLIPFSKGIFNIAASLGTALTLEQISLIKRYTSNVILCYDSDKAGQMATLRALDLLLENDMKVKIIQLPKGYDPDSFLREKTLEAFKKLLDDKLDFFDYKLSLLKDNINKDTIEGKSKIASDLFISINKLKSVLERYEYIKKLSLYLNIKEEVLIAEYKKLYPGPKEYNKPSTGQGRINISAKNSLTLTEKIIFKYMFTQEKAFVIIRRHLKPGDFTSVLAKEISSFVWDNNSQEENISNIAVLGKIKDNQFNGIISNILLDDTIPINKEVLKSSIRKLQGQRIKDKKSLLRRELLAAENKGDSQRIKELVSEYDAIRLK